MTADKNIERLFETWKQLQPLKEEDQRRLDQKFMLDFNYNSNRLEGNTLTYGQTKLLLIFDQTEGTASMRDYQEMKAHNVGLQQMKREAEDRERPLTENFIRTLNQTIQAEDYRKLSQDGKSSFEIHVGVYKTRPNSVKTVTGEEFHYASPEETPALVKDLVEWYNKEENQVERNPIELAAMFHYRYIRIHPFEDGNGRVARLMVNYILHRHGYPMIVVPTNDKTRYLQLLHQCDMEVGLTPSEGASAKAENLQPFTDYLSELVEHALDLAIRAGRGESIEEPSDFAKRIRLIEKQVKEKQLKPKRNSEEIWNVLEYFYFPLEKVLNEKAKEASVIFFQSSWYNLISKYPDIQTNECFHLNYVDRSGQNAQIREYVKAAQSMWYTVKLISPHNIKSDHLLEIKQTLNIQFKEEYYEVSLLDKKYPYGYYPSEKDKQTVVKKFTDELIGKIEALI